MSVNPIDPVRRPRRMPPFALGVPLESLRSDATTESVIEAVTERARESAWFRARVDVDRRSWADGGDHGGLVPMLKALSRRRLLELRIHDRLSDDEALAVAGELDILVTPTVTGLTGGWLEMCHELGAAIVAPRQVDTFSRPGWFTYPVFPTGLAQPGDLRDAIEAASRSLMSGKGERTSAAGRKRRRAPTTGQDLRLYGPVPAAPEDGRDPRPQMSS